MRNVSQQNTKVPGLQFEIRSLNEDRGFVVCNFIHLMQTSFCGFLNASMFHSESRLTTKLSFLHTDTEIFSSSAIDEVGGVPYEILEPVLERCTPEQLYRIEQCNQVCILSCSSTKTPRNA